MTERRPYWTDDLIEAVGREAWGYMFNPVMGHIRADQEEAIYGIIAAVEDWQDKQIIGCRYACIGSQGAEIADLKAQIQRAREVLNRWVYRPPLSLLDEVTRALNGDNDD